MSEMKSIKILKNKFFVKKKYYIFYIKNYIQFNFFLIYYNSYYFIVILNIKRKI